jgi:hypothetical protein
MSPSYTVDIRKTATIADPTEVHREMAKQDPLNARASLNTPLGARDYYRLGAMGEVSHLPYSIRVLLEAVLRHCDGYVVTEDHARAVATSARPRSPSNPGEWCCKTSPASRQW